MTSKPLEPGRDHYGFLDIPLEHSGFAKLLENMGKTGRPDRHPPGHECKVCDEVRRRKL